jgi:hypothetical protein
MSVVGIVFGPRSSLPKRITADRRACVIGLAIRTFRQLLVRQKKKAIRPSGMR